MLKGIPVSGGFAIGKILKLENPIVTYDKSSFLGAQQEWERYQQALRVFTRQTESSASAIRRIVGKEEADIFTGHIYMAHDPDIQRRIKQKIARGFNAETATESACDGYIEAFLGAAADSTKQKAADLKDIKKAFLTILTGTQAPEQQIPFGTVIAAQELTPSAVRFMERRRTVAAVAETGTAQAHFAALMRAMGIPAVLSVKGLMQHVFNAQNVIVDAQAGEIIEI